MFDHIGWEHVYEPINTSGYIPDFLILGKHPFLVEVKPAATQQDYLAATGKIQQHLTGHWNHEILIVGASPVVAYSEITSDSAPLFGTSGIPAVEKCKCCSDPVSAFIGWMGRIWGNQWQYSPAAYFSYGTEERTKYGIWEYIVNAHHPHCPGGDSIFLDPSEVKRIWAEACNSVKWRPKASEDPEERALRLLQEELGARPIGN